MYRKWQFNNNFWEILIFGCRLYHAKFMIQPVYINCLFQTTHPYRKKHRTTHCMLSMNPIGMHNLYPYSRKHKTRYSKQQSHGILILNVFYIRYSQHAKLRGFTCNYFFLHLKIVKNCEKF